MDGDSSMRLLSASLAPAIALPSLTCGTIEAISTPSWSRAGEYGGCPRRTQWGRRGEPVVVGAKQRKGGWRSLGRQSRHVMADAEQPPLYFDLLEPSEHEPPKAPVMFQASEDAFHLNSSLRA